MTYQVLARKWRPRDFASLVGQEHVVRALTHALDQKRLHHAYLFTGTRGVGKTTLSRILAKALNCETGITSNPCGQCKACREIDEGRFIDYVEMDAASNRGVDEMAALLERAVYAPVDARFKVYMIDEVHMLSNHAFNAMLKTLEEPPSHVKFILATTDPQRIPVTVLSRCLQFNLKQMPATHIVSHLEHVLTDEQIVFETQALRLLARAADGSMRDALSLTDQAIAYAAGTVSEDAIRGMLGALDQSYLIRLLDAIAQADGAAVLAIADEMAARSLSFSVALQDLSSLLHRVAWAQYAPASVLDEWPEAADIRRFAEALAPRDIQLYYQIATIGRSELGVAPDEYAGFTMTLLRMLAFQPAGAGDVPPPGPIPVGAAAGSRPTPEQAARSPAQAAGVATQAVRLPASVPARPVGSAAGRAMPQALTPAALPTPSAAQPVLVKTVTAAAPEDAFAPLPEDTFAPLTDAPVAALAQAPYAVVEAGDISVAASQTAPAVLETAGVRTVPQDMPQESVQAAQETPSAVVPAAPQEVLQESVQAAPVEAPNPARAALDALRSAGLRISPERKRAEAAAVQRPRPALAGPPVLKTYGPRLKAEAFCETPGTSTDSGVPPWDDMPSGDFYPMEAGSSFDDAVSVDFAERSPAGGNPVGLGSKSVEAPPQVDLAPLGFAGDWPKLAALLPLKGLAQQLACQSELIALQDETLKLRAPAPLTDAAQVAKLKSVLTEHLGRTVSLMVEAGVARWSAATVAAVERARLQWEAEQAIAQDNFIQALVRDFDAKIIAGSIRPIQ